MRDIALAHLAAADHVGEFPRALNIGTSRGGSIRVVIKLGSAAAGRTDVVATKADRRAGDPAFPYADVSLIKNSIGFVAKYSLEASTESLF